MKLLIIGVVLAVPTAVEIETKKAGEPSPPVAAPQDGRERRFTVEVEFSRAWESSERIRRFVRQGVRPRSSAKDELDELIDRFASAEPSNDPLYVACRVDCAAVPPDGWLAVLSVTGMAYRDLEPGGATGRARPDRSWRIDSKTPDRKRAAAGLIEDLALAWRFPLSTAEERSALEAQLTAAALVFLESRPVKVRLDAVRSEMSFPDIDQLLASALPEEFPQALRGHVVWFLEETLVRGFGPGSRALSPGGRFEFRGVPYEVEPPRSKKANGVLARAREKRERSGLALREDVFLDRGTGRTIESRGIVVYAPRLGDTLRFGATRWHVRREDSP